MSTARTSVGTFCRCRDDPCKPCRDPELADSDERVPTWLYFAVGGDAKPGMEYWPAPSATVTGLLVASASEAERLRVQLAEMGKSPLACRICPVGLIASGPLAVEQKENLHK